MTRLRDLPPLLFTRGDLRLALEKQAYHAAETARTMNPDRVLSSPTEDLVQELVGTFWVNPLKLLTDKVSAREHRMSTSPSRHGVGAASTLTAR